MPAHNQLEYCRACINSIRAHTRRVHHLVLINNGSTDGVGDYFDSVIGATVIHSGENLGFAGGVNLGLAVATGHVLLLNSDTLVPPGWLNHLEEALLANESLGAIGPVTNCASGPQQLDDARDLSPDRYASFAEHRWQQHGPRVTEATRLAGFCMLLRDGVWQSVGDFDTRFGIGNFEDDDYSTRIRQAGHGLGIAQGCFVYHFGGRTFAGMGLEGRAYNALLEENRQKYMDKWNVFIPSAMSLAQSRAATLAREARQATADGDSGRAIQLYRDAITQDPSNPDFFFALADALAYTGHRELAVETYRAGLKRSPEDAEAQRKLEALLQGE